MSQLIFKTILVITVSIVFLYLPTVTSININLNRGRAQAFGRDGSLSVSDAQTYGAEVGIRRAGGPYEVLQRHTGGGAGSFSSGDRAPKTWASGNSQFGGNGNFGGNAGAGFHGGSGSVQTVSHTKKIAVPLDNQGTVLYSNLKLRKKPEPTEE